MAKTTEDSSYHKLFRQSYSIKEFSTSKANTENELQKVKMPFLQRGFFDANLVGLFNNNSNSSIDNRERHTNFAIKTAESKTKIYSFALTSNPRISYKTGVQKSQGYSLHCVAKVFCFIKHFCYFSLSKPRE